MIKPEYTSRLTLRRSVAVLVLTATFSLEAAAGGRTTNQAPIISGTPPVSVVAGSSYGFRPTASDPEGHALKFRIANRPVWASFSSSTGRLSGTPGANHVGEYVDIRIRVSDGRNTTELPAFAIDVQQSATQHQVSLTINGPGTVRDTTNGIDCAAACTYAFPEGLTLNLGQLPAAGAHFSSWSGACSTASQCSVNVSGPLNITATFVADDSSAPVPSPSGDTLAKLLNFAETWDRNWNFGGHEVTAAFTESYGKWDYTESTYEPWLFDRATVGYRLFELTGDSRWSDKFLSDFAYYRAHIDSQGIFTPKGQGDTKYSYVTPFALYERLTGDQQYRPIAKLIYDRWISEWPSSYNPDTSFWTEREMAFALEAAVSWLEMTGDAGARARADALVNQWSVVSGSAGAPLHTLAQHGEEFDNAYASMKMTSSWMAALYFQAARRYYVITNNSQVLEQVSKYADFIDLHGIVDGSAFHQEYAGIKVPYYLYGVGTFYDRETPGQGDLDHCLDVGGLLKFAIFAKQQLGQSTSAVQTRHSEMKACSDRNFSDWTRDTVYLPKYRLNPPRKFNWQFRGFYEDAL